MATGRQPGSETAAGRAEVRTGKADGIESQFAAPAPYVFLEVGRSLCAECVLTMHDDHLTLALADESATVVLGAHLAAHLVPGMVVWLGGDLGAGKTTLVRGLLRAAGESGPVKSPTYTLVEVHVVSGLNFYHFDFYRFNHAEEYLDAGLDEYFSGAGICLVEWPEKAAPYLPAADIQIELRVPSGSTDAGRVARISAASERGRTCLAGVMSSSTPPPG